MANKQHASTFNFCGMQIPIENTKAGESGSFDGPSPGETMEHWRKRKQEWAEAKQGKRPWPG